VGDLDLGGMSIMDLKEMRCKGVGWIQMPYDRVQRWSLVNTVINNGVL
jgi:hypothetical protein